jgi:hypothetical protein
MRKDVLLSDPGLIEPFITPAVAAAARSETPFQFQFSYRALAAYLYVLEGSTHAVHERLSLPVSLFEARRAMRLRRRCSLGCGDAVPFLRSAPVLGLAEEDIAILEVLALIARTKLLNRRWGNPTPIRLMAWLLCEDQRVLEKRLRGALSAWSLVRLTHEDGLVSACMTPRAIDLFSATRSDVQANRPSTSAPAPALPERASKGLGSCPLGSPAIR